MTTNVAQIKEKVEALGVKIITETDRNATWKKENERRRHNYVPLIFDLLH